MRTFFNGTLLRGTLVVLTLVSVVACGGGSSKKKTPASSVTINSSLSSNNNVSVGSSLKNASASSMLISSTSLTSTSSNASLTSLPSSSVSSTTKSSLSSFLMGGSIQHLPLNLLKEVSTFSGVPGGADGTRLEARFNLAMGIASDGTNLYIADTENHTIRKIVLATGAVTTLAGTVGETGNTDGTGTAARFKKPKGITVNGANLYVTDTGNITVRKIVIATGVVTTFAGTANTSGSNDGTGIAAKFSIPIGITNDGTNLYVADSGNNIIRKIVMSSGVVTTLAGTAGMMGSTDGTGAAARFNTPTGVFSDGTNVYVTDTGNHTLRKIVISSALVTIFAGAPGVSGTTNAISTAARFNSPTGIAGDNANLYVADSDSHTIRKIVISSQTVSKLVGRAGISGASNGNAITASFNKPSGIALAGNSIYVADRDNSLVREYSVADDVLMTYAGIKVSSDGTGNSVSFANPTSITTDGTNLYVADPIDNTIRKIVIDTGVVSTFAGASTQPGAVDGAGSVARFSYPSGITTDGINLYVADTENHVIRKIAIESAEVTTLAGLAGGNGSADGDSTTARFSRPSAVTTDGLNVYVADQYNDTIRKVVIATGVVTTLAGTAGEIGGTDGVGADARFNYPSGIATDGTTLYVADQVNHTIRKIVIASRAVTTLAGTALAFGTADGMGTNARFNFCRNISSDGTYLYVTDTANHTVRKIDKATGGVTTIAGAAGTPGNANGIDTAAKFNYPIGITNDEFNVYVTDYSNNTIRKIH
jgi:DNA-binding beta-propeller fold protein YncE